MKIVHIHQKPRLGPKPGQSQGFQAKLEPAHHYLLCIGPPSYGALWCVDCNLGPVQEVGTVVDIAELLPDIQD